MDRKIQPTESAAAERRAWWSAHRRQYNIALLISAPISAASLFAVWAVFEDRLPCLEISGFSIAFGIILFALGLGLANICYFLGPLAERLVRPHNAIAFRRWVYATGLALLLLLVFSSPLMNLHAAILRLPCVDKFGNRTASTSEFRSAQSKPLTSPRDDRSAVRDPMSVVQHA
jgi:hypothetical protein